MVEPPGFSLRKACEAYGLKCNTVLGWIDTLQLGEQYARARATMQDVMAEDLERIGEAAAIARDPTTVAGLRLQSDNRKWLLSKVAARKYGDKLALGGAEDLPPVRSETTIDLSNATEEQLRAIAALTVNPG